MKYSLVLSGGGSKGAYEAGAIKALRELEIDFDIVTGTSIGAFNGLLVAQQDYQALYHLWDTMTLEDVLKHPIDLGFSIDSFLKQSNLIKPFFKSYLNEKGADITPLKDLVHGLYNHDHLYDSPIDYGLVTVKFPSLSPLQITKKEMLPIPAVEYAIASASCFPAFPIHDIEGQGYIDGGYFDNLPIALAMSMGAKNIIAVELNQEPTHEYLIDKPSITFIRPSHDLGGFLDFSRDLLDQRIKLGYYDTMKVFKQYRGYEYIFTNQVLNTNRVDAFYNHILKYEISLNNRMIKTTSEPLTSLLKENTYIKSLTKEDYYIRTIELLMKDNNYNITNVYELDNTLNILYDIFKKKEERVSNSFIEGLKDLSKDEAVIYIYHCLINDKPIKVPLMMFYNEYLYASLFFILTKEE